MPFGLDLDYEYIEEEEEEELEKFWELVTPITEYHNCCLVKMSLNTFFSNTSCWAYNRELDNERVLLIKNAILKNEFLPSTFTLVDYNDNIWLVDGQHRKEALDQITRENPDFEYDIVAIVHTASSEKEIINIFRKVNDTKALSPQDVPNDILVQVMEQLSERFPKGIKKTSGKVYYPNINYTELKKKLAPIITNNTDPNDFVLKIRKINRQYGKMPLIPNIKKKIGKQSMQKARDNCFWLGLDTEWSWINNL